MKRSLRAQCILLLPPLVTSANSREASVFSIFLLMMSTSVDRSLAVSASCQRSGCASCRRVMCIFQHRMSPPRAKGSATTCRYVVVDDCVPRLYGRQSGLAYPSHLDIWCNIRPPKLPIWTTHCGRGRGGEAVPRHRHPLGVRFRSAGPRTCAAPSHHSSQQPGLDALSGGRAIEANVVAADTQSAPLHRNAGFLLLWAGQFVSQMGDRLAALAFPWLVYTTTGSALGTGAVFALYTLPYVLFGAVAGVVVDRLDKRRLMIAVDLIRAVLVARGALRRHALAGGGVRAQLRDRDRRRVLRARQAGHAPGDRDAGEAAARQLAVLHE